MTNLIDGEIAKICDCFTKNLQTSLNTYKQLLTVVYFQLTLFFSLRKKH